MKEKDKKIIDNKNEFCEMDMLVKCAKDEFIKKIQNNYYQSILKKKNELVARSNLNFVVQEEGVIEIKNPFRLYYFDGTLWKGIEKSKDRVILIKQIDISDYMEDNSGF